MQPRPTARLFRALGHPIFLACLVLLILNDHVFKAQWPGSYWTGKLSDVAWLVVAPVVFGALLAGARVPAARWVSLGMVGLVFTVLQLWPPLGDTWVAWMGGAHVADAGDLVTLPALGLAYLCWATAAPRMHHWGRRVVGTVALTALVATSGWNPPPDGRSPCAYEDAWDPARPLAIAWSAPDHSVPDDFQLLAEGIQIWDDEGLPVSYTLKWGDSYSVHDLLICPDGGLEPDRTYTWKVGGWPDLGAHTIGVPSFYLDGVWQFTTASESTWTAGCSGTQRMAYVETDSCAYDSGMSLGMGWY